QYGAPLEALSRYNAPGLSWVENPNRANIQRGWNASAAYVQEDPVPERTYNADYPARLQRQDWTCAVVSTWWLLNSIGIAIDAGDLQDEMVGAGLEAPGVGLLVAEASPLATWLRDRWGLEVEHTGWADWGWLTARAGQGPVIMGGRRWDHW